MPEASRRPLRILYYVEGLDIGGANKTTITSAVAMRRRGHTVCFASLDGPLRDRLTSFGILHIAVDTRVNHPSFAVARRIARILREQRIDVVCANGYECLMDALLATLPSGTPVVPTFGAMLNPEYAHPRVPKALVFSGEFRDILIRYYGWKPEALELLINRIDTERFRPGLDPEPFRRRFGLKEGEPVVLMACRLDPLKIKGVHFLLDSVGELAERVPPVRVVIVGDGDLSHEIEERVIEINRASGFERVILTGKIIEMETAFPVADVVLGNGARSGLEGLACGKPVISVGASGFGGVFTPENIEHFAYYNFDKGRVFDGTTRWDPSTLAATLEDLLKDRDRRAELEKFGREYATRRLGIEAGAARMEEILVAARRRNVPQRLGDAWEFVRCIGSFGGCLLRRRWQRGMSWSRETLRPRHMEAKSAAFVRDSARTFFTQILALAVGVIQAAVVARALLPEGKGALASALLIPQLLVALAPLGMDWASTFHLGRKSYDRETIARTLSGALVLLGGIAMLVCVGVSVLLRNGLLVGVPAAATLLGVATIPTQIALLFLDGLFRGEMRIYDANRMSANRTVLMFFGTLLALLALHLGVSGVILGQVVAEAVVIVLALRRFRVANFRPLFDWHVFRTMLSYGLQVYSFGILLYLNYRFDLFLVRYLLDLKETGLYSTAVALGEILWLVPTSMGRVLFPSIARSLGSDRNALTLAVCRTTFWVMLLLCAVLGLCGNFVVGFYFGSAFLPAVPALWALLPGILLMSLQQVLGADLSGRGRPLAVTLGSGIGFTTNVILNLLWIPRLGIVGAALASTVSYGIVTVVVIAAFFRITGSRLRDAFLMRREDWGWMTGLILKMKGAVVPS